MTYNYKCKQCGTFTLERSMKDEPLEKCPKCGNEIKRIYNAVGTVVKCDGFFGKSK